MSVYDFNQYNTAYYGTSLAAGSLGTCITHTGKTISSVIVVPSIVWALWIVCTLMFCLSFYCYYCLYHVFPSTLHSYDVSTSSTVKKKTTENLTQILAYTIIYRNAVMLKFSP